MSARATMTSTRLGTQWMVGSGIGGAVGIPLGAATATLVRFALAGVAGGILTIALDGAIFGLVIGMAQALARRDLVDALPWTLLSGLGGLLGFALGTRLATTFSDPLSGNVVVYLSEGVGYLTFGAVLGLLLGLAQVLAWRKDTMSPQAWLAATVLGMAVGALLAGAVGELFTGFPIEPLREALYGVFLGLAPGVAHHVLVKPQTETAAMHPS